MVEIRSISHELTSQRIYKLGREKIIIKGRNGKKAKIKYETVFESLNEIADKIGTTTSTNIQLVNVIRLTPTCKSNSNVIGLKLNLLYRKYKSTN